MSNKRKISYNEALFELPRSALVEALQDMSVIASEAVFKPIRENKKDYEVADAVGEAVIDRVLRFHKAYEDLDRLLVPKIDTLVRKGSSK